MKDFFRRWFGDRPRSGHPESAAAYAPADSDAPDDVADTLQAAKRLAKSGHFKRAIALLEPIAQSSQASADIFLVLGTSYFLNGQCDAAVATLERAMALAPTSDAAALNLANALRDRGDIERAQETLQTLLSRNTRNADALDVLGLLELDADNPAAAIALFDRALSHQPQHTRARFNRALALLRSGRSAEAWPDYELRAAASYRIGRPIVATPWHGEPAHDKSLFIYAEQGIGDEILFASCFAAATARVKSCTVECSSKLQRLFCESFPHIHFLARDWHASHTLPPESATADIVVAAGSLLRWFRPFPETEPAISPYLRVEREHVIRWRKRFATMGGGPYIGLSWRGGTRFTRQHFRAVELAQLAPLFKAVPQATFVNLLHSATRAEIEEAHQLSGGRFVHFADGFADMADTAAIVTALDLTITVPTTLVSLASALGTPIWVCTTKGAGWMYGHQGETSPWLPGARLFRQNNYFEWGDVVSSIASQLTAWSRHNSRSQIEP